MKVQFSEINLQAALKDPNYIKSQSDLVINELLRNLDLFSKPDIQSKDLFGCSITLADLDFQLHLDFFRKRNYNNNFLLLEKIKFLRRMIININDIFIKIISDLRCCTSNDAYNKTVIPIFKWLVEDENGLSGTLLKISKEIYNIYIPIKRLMCLFRNIPGNPTLSYGGTDFLKAIYPLVEGLNKLADVLDNGAFLDIIIIPVKNFHDKLVACSSGDYIKYFEEEVDFFEAISSGLIEELNMSLIDQLKSVSNLNKVDMNLPKEPIYPIDTFRAPPKPNEYKNMAEYRKALSNYNIEHLEANKEKNREYNEAYDAYLTKLTEYKQKKYESTFSLGNVKVENSNLALGITMEKMKAKHKPVCGCLGELFRLDGFFFPKKHIIRNESDFMALVGEVRYLGINSEDYYEDQSIDGLNSKRRLKILRESDLGDLRYLPVKTSLDIVMEGAFVSSGYRELINSAKHIQDVIDIDTSLRNTKAKKVKELGVMKSEASGLWDSFYNLHQDYLKREYKRIALNRVGMADIGNLDTTGSNFGNSSARYIEEIRRSQRILQELSHFPPLEWIQNPDNYVVEYGAGAKSFRDYLEAVESSELLEKEIADLNMAIERNHCYIDVVDNSYIPCSCDLLCMILQYIIGIIMDIIKKLITYLIDFLMKSIMNKELQWWLDFIISKVNCILDLINLPNELSNMQKRFNAEIKGAKNSIKKMSQYLAGCSGTDSKISSINMNKQKLPVDLDSIPDITWDPTTYPEFVQPDNDQTPTLKDPNDKNDQTFSVELKNVGYEENEWKNRTIPTIILDCTKEHFFKIHYKPLSFTWSIYLDITIDSEQFGDSPNILLNGNTSLTEEQIISHTYDTIIWNLMNALYSSSENYSIKLNIDNHIISTITKESFLKDENIIINSIIYDINDIDKVYILFDTEMGYVKIFDRTMTKKLEDFYEDHKKTMIEINENIANTEIEIEEIDDSATKICTTKNLKINSLTLLYPDKTSDLYAGTIKENSSYDANYDLIKFFEYTPSTREDGPLDRPNVPFLLELENGAGYILKVILLVDVCIPNMVENIKYDPARDGIFLNGRYDYFEFDSIKNDSSITWSETEIIKKLKRYLENIGMISGSNFGYLASNSAPADGDSILNEDHLEEYGDYLDKDQLEEGEDLSMLDINLIPEGEIQNGISKSQAKIKELESILTNTEAFISKSMQDFQDILETNKIEVQDGKVILKETEYHFAKKDSWLGIPIMVLNEEENIVLTIHQKKLKLINLNRNFGATDPDLIIDQEIDYKNGESLFIEFSTNGFSHTISWMNERKIKEEASTTIFNSVDLIPSYIGSIYKNENPIALLCGKINDIIISEIPNESEKWWENNHKYIPAGTIGFYDFSLFDGYHVYSIPEYFKVTTIEKLATVKGILYETSEYTQAEINQLIQDGKYNDLAKTQITIIGKDPISVGGDFIWKNKKYYKNVSFGYLDNFFCRDNLLGKSFTISFWLKQKDSLTNDRENFKKKYIFSDIHNGNFIWYEDDILNIKIFGNLLRSEPVTMLFKKDVTSIEPEFVEKWYHHVFRYDRTNAKVFYSIDCIDRNYNFDINYDRFILDKKSITINLKNIEGRGKVMDFSLVSMLARYDVKTLKYTDYFHAEIAALSIFNEYKDDNFIKDLNTYQKIIIQNEMED